MSTSNKNLTPPGSAQFGYRDTHGSMNQGGGNTNSKY